MTIISVDYIKKRGCLTRTHRCKFLKILKIKDINGKYRAFHNCVSEEELCCGCCKEMQPAYSCKNCSCEMSEQEYTARSGICQSCWAQHNGG